MKNSIGKPYEGKLHVRFDEGGADSLHIFTTFMVYVRVDYQALLYVCHASCGNPAGENPV